MPTVEEVLAVAASQIGVTESPPGSNRTAYGRWYGLNGQPWCAIFLQWVFAKAGGDRLLFRTAYTPSLAGSFKAVGRWHTTPQPGDLVFFNFPGGHDRIEHVGLVERVGRTGLQTIEGNTGVGNDANGGAVMRRDRVFGPYIAGYGRPVYEPSTPQEDDHMTDAQLDRLIAAITERFDRLITVAQEIDNRVSNIERDTVTPPHVEHR